MDLTLFLAIGCDNAIGRILQVVHSIMTVLYIAVPVLIILWGTFDLLKAVVANDDKKMSEAWKMVMKRLIYGVAIFLLGIITTTVLDMAGANYNKCGVTNSGAQLK